MEANLFRYIWRHSRRDQLAILLLVVLSLPFYFLSLNLPKQIVNQGIQGQGFDSVDDTRFFGRIHLPFGEAMTGEPILLFEGLELAQPGFLLALSFTFLALVCVNGGFKFVINTAKGRLGERMLRRLRYELTDRLLRFRLRTLRRMKSAEVATMIKDEVEPLGGFIGDAFVTPAFLGGQAITAMVFIMIQSVWLGLVAGAVLAIQAILIPKLRVPILRLGKERQLTARQLAGRIGEVMDGAVEVHAHDASNWERAELTGRLGRIFAIRFEIFQRKFFVKFLNNFLGQFTPFVFYAAGGLLAINGQLDIGALVAVIAAYKDLPGPVRELLNWEQTRNDVQIKYDQVIEQFQPTDVVSSAQQDPSVEVTPFEGDLKVSGLTLTDESNNRILDQISFEMPLESATAVVGDAASGKDHLALLLAALVPPAGGSIQIGAQALTKLPEAATGRRLGYVGPDAYLFPQSVRENLVYGLKHRPLADRERDGEALKQHHWHLAEARKTGNIDFDPQADWIDYAAAGCDGPDALERQLLEILNLVDLNADVYRFGLGRTIDPEKQPEVAAGLMKARARLTERLAAQGQEDLVVRFDRAAYNPNASLAENLLFGTPRKPEYAPQALPDNRLVLEVLREAELEAQLLAKGLSIAETMVEIFADLPPGHPFFDQFSFISADDLPEFRQLVQRAEKSGADGLPEVDRKRLLALPFRYVDARHRLDLIDDDFRERLLKARDALHHRIETEDADAVEFYDARAYNAAASLMDNILFGRLVYGRAEAEETVGATVSETLEELGLHDAVVLVGLDYNVGVAGKLLSASQRQKVAIARALLKRPDLLILNEATAVMDGATRSHLLDRLLQHRGKTGIVWALERARLAERFDRVLVLQNGRLVEQGAFCDLRDKGRALPDLLASD
ncbi:ATP-binding cassette domain-containing protein [Algihabitans sp.]|uniref:ATP-binding cassette domain-containing protein n=1 Tax=Algihabitans sp. TaxID=2821514 RepID=UPI003BAA5864